MPESEKLQGFSSLNGAYNFVFRPNRLSLGLVVPIENYAVGALPKMTGHTERALMAEALGFSALWLRDVPFNVPSFGDSGQIYDPFVYLGMLAGLTKKISLGMAAVVLPLRHPAHVAKAAASADILSGGRLILGVASGDRPEEYPALNMPFEERGERFRASFEYIRRMGENAPEFDNPYGNPKNGLDMVPKPTSKKLPLILAGDCRQSPEWIAQNGDGRMFYPRNAVAQEQTIREWRQRVKIAGRSEQPVLEPLYVDLLENPKMPPQAIHLGLRLGTRALRAYLKSREKIGVNHIALNLRFNQTDIETTLKRLADEVLPDFA